MNTEESPKTVALKSAQYDGSMHIGRELVLGWNDGVYELKYNYRFKGMKANASIGEKIGWISADGSQWSLNFSHLPKDLFRAAKPLFKGIGGDVAHFKPIERP